MAKPNKRLRANKVGMADEATVAKFGFETGDPDFVEAIENHIATQVGPIAFTYHEIAAAAVHIDVHVVAPAPDRDYYTLITSGMSSRAMTPPSELADQRFAELVLCLPADWPMSDEDLLEDANRWPIDWLRYLAHYPHQHRTWLWATHTVPNGNPPEPLAQDTTLCCALLAFPMLLSPEFCDYTMGPDRHISFLSVVPVYKQEMEYALSHGAIPLIEQLWSNGVSELLDLHRPNLYANQTRQ